MSADISYGGAISVDPEALRDVAARAVVLRAAYDEARSAIGRAYRRVVDTAGLSSFVDIGALWRSAEKVERLIGDCDDIVVGTRLMADVYEYVELKAEAEALAIADQAAADRLFLRMEQLAASDDRIVDMAAMLTSGWEGDRFEGLDRQFDAGGFLAPFFAGAALLGANGPLGTVPRGATLSGRADSVTVIPVRTSAPVNPPDGLADALRRMPTAEGSQVAVEKLTNPDGSVRYVAYLKGTQSGLAGGSEPWDMKSNFELYSGQKSASFQATVDALAAAGASLGDRVDVVAHSQAGMIAAYLEGEGGFDVGVQITAGSPVSPLVGGDEVLIQLRHSDDVVSSLAGGGSPGGSGAPGSFTATREDVTGLPVVDAIDPHLLESYEDLATEVDGSGDSRVAALDDYWRELGEATSIERTEFHAERDG